MSGVSLVVATIGRVDELKRLIESLHAQSRQEYEVIVVDQNPDDRLDLLIDHARMSGLVVQHIKQRDPNQCDARNRGLSLAQFDLVAFPDDDCWYEPEVLERVFSRFAAADAPNGVVARWPEQQAASASPHLIANQEWRRYREAQASMITQFYRRELLLRVGGFDTRLGLHSWFGSGEETDLMFRVLESGASVAYLPEAVVHHPFRRVPPGNIANVFRRSRSRARGTGAIYAKHRLEVWVILRGLISPWLYALVNLPKPRALVTYLGMGLGRLEGYVRWRISE